MSEREPVHLDSRRLEPRDGDEEPLKYYDYLVNLNDAEAIESSPFRSALEALNGYGFTQINIGHPMPENSENYLNEWWVMGIRAFPGTEPMVADNLGGKLAVCAQINEDGERQLEFSFGAGDYQTFDHEDLNEIIWRYLEVIHGAVSRGWEGRKLPLALPEQP